RSAAGRAGAAPSSMRPTTLPMATVVPSGTVIASVPAAGAGISPVAFSVSNSRTGSPARTTSPFRLSQRAIVPSLIDSPTEGILMSTGIRAPSDVSLAFAPSHANATTQAAIPTTSDWRHAHRAQADSHRLDGHGHRARRGRHGGRSP